MLSSYAMDIIRKAVPLPPWYTPGAFARGQIRPLHVRGGIPQHLAMTMPWGGHYYYAAGGFVWTGGDITGTAQRPGGEDGPPIARFPASLRARETIDRVAEQKLQ